MKSENIKYQLAAIPIDKASHLASAIALTVEHMVDEMSYLANRHQGELYGVMSRSEYAQRECDYAAYHAISRELAFLRGCLTDAGVDLPEAPEFPSMQF